MEIFTIKIEGCKNIIISIDLTVAILIITLIVLSLVLARVYKKCTLKTIRISEAVIGIGSASVTIKYDGRIKEIAYRIWIELTTRKIGIQFDENYDVISEVYDSWYESFKIIRRHLEEIPASRIDAAKGLIELTTKVLNNGMRPHLTMWQAKYRRWYENALEKDKDLSPQELQKKFPEYKSLVNDLKRTNEIMLNYANQLKRLIDNE